MKKITIVGSINLDTTLRVSTLAKPGETCHSTGLSIAGGGKGANQGVAAKRLGAEVAFIGAVGNDTAGEQMMGLLRKEGLDTTGISVLEGSTGQAFITVDNTGENSIVIHSGANGSMTPEHIMEHGELIEASDAVIAQLESSIESTMEAFRIGRAAKVMTVLNPAPGREDVPLELLGLTDVIIPNETETEILTGIKIKNDVDLKEAANYFHDLGIGAVIITLGSKGAFYSAKGQERKIPALTVVPVDTTAAGDTFIGAVTSVLLRDLSNIEEAVVFGNLASSVTVQGHGAQPSIPYSEDLN